MVPTAVLDSRFSSQDSIALNALSTQRAELKYRKADFYKLHSTVLVAAGH